MEPFNLVRIPAPLRHEILATVIKIFDWLWFRMLFGFLDVSQL
jgi:hypothetical protein